MQGVTHLLSGILIQKSLESVKPNVLRYSLIFILVIFAHWFLDRLARLTYHSCQPLTEDWFWIIYHILMIFLFLYVLIEYWPRYKFGMIISILPDLDYFIIYPARFLGLDYPILKEPILHKTFFDFLDRLPVLSLINRLPDLRLVRATVILEFSLIAVFFVIIKLWDKKEKI